jgi:hypothetical protein
MEYRPMNKIKEVLEFIAAQPSYDTESAEFYESCAKRLNNCKSKAQEALAALEKDGYVLVPVEPNEEMLAATGKVWADRCHNSITLDQMFTDLYQEMIKAAQEG